jgi:hypothetical protein
LPQASQNTLAANPLIGIQRSDVAAAARSLLGLIAVSPQRATLHFANYVKELISVVKGDSTLAPDPERPALRRSRVAIQLHLPATDAQLPRHAQGTQ